MAKFLNYTASPEKSKKYYQYGVLASDIAVKLFNSKITHFHYNQSRLLLLALD